MNTAENELQSYFRMLEQKLDAYFRAVINKEPAEELNAEVKGFLEAGMVLKVTSKDVLDAKIKSRYELFRSRGGGFGTGDA